MAQLDIRQRAGYLLLAVMLGHIILISAQVNSRRGVPMLEEVTFGAFAEVQRGLWAGVSGVRNLWSGYLGLRDVRTENERLRGRLAEAEIELQEQRALADRSRSLEQLLELRSRTSLSTLATAVIGGGASPDFRTLTLDKGTDAGVVVDMAVIAPAGVVGRIVLPSSRAAKVQLLIDRNAAAGALVERTRAQGVVVGAGDENTLRMEFVAETAEVAVGDLVVTSGIDGIYPKGFPIGLVERVDKSGVGYREIAVKPAVDYSRLEEVLVVLTPPPSRETGEERTR